MPYTKFGEFMRILRIKHREVMGDMAEMLGVAVPFLSAVENGRKNVPNSWIERIVSHYGLTAAEQRDLRDAVDESRTQYKIMAEKAGPVQRKAALVFARSFDNMDDETASKILELLKNKVNARGNNGLRDKTDLKA